MKEEKINRNIMFTLIALPYAPEALEPVISKETIGFHHGKHLQAYVDNLNKLLPGSGYERVWLWRKLCERLRLGRYLTMQDRY